MGQHSQHRHRLRKKGGRESRRGGGTPLSAGGTDCSGSCASASWGGQCGECGAVFGWGEGGKEGQGSTVGVLACVLLCDVRGWAG
jgi:hypothetical protein